MKLTQKEQKQWYQGHINYVCHELGITRLQYFFLKRLGNKLQGVYTDNCNGDLSEEDFIDAELKITKQIEAYVKPMGLHVFYQTDPRGASLYLSRNRIPENSYNNASCVY